MATIAMCAIATLWCLYASFAMKDGHSENAMVCAVIAVAFAIMANAVRGED